MKKNTYIYVLLLAVILFTTYCSKPGSTSTKETNFISCKDPNFVYLGRIDTTQANQVRFAYTGVSIRFRFEGSTCIVRLKNYSTTKDANGVMYKNYYAVTVDDGKPQLFGVSNEDKSFKLRGLSKGIHEVVLFKRTEPLVGEGIFEGVELEAGKLLLSPSPSKTRKIEFIGNSITCGYGNEGTSKDCHFSPETENGYMSYGAIAARKLQADFTIVAYSGKGMYRNYDGTTTNTTSLIYDRIYPDSLRSPKWKFTSWQPELIVLNLGTNDFAKGIPDSVIFVNTYVNFLKRLRLNYPSATLLCIQGPMMTDEFPKGAAHLTHIKNYIKASKLRMELIGDTNIYTFFASTQTADEFGCDFHPQIKRHELMADELVKYIRSIKKW